MSNLSKIYIRAKVDGKWGSYSLQEILDTGNAGQIISWFLERAVGVREADLVTESAVHRMVNTIRATGQEVAELVAPPDRTEDT